jgi:Flp pilus assembly protein TadG
MIISPSVFRRFAVSNQGTTAIEFAVVSPFFILLVIGSIEFGRMVWTQNSLQFATEQATRCAVIKSASCGTAAQIQQYAANKMFGQTINASIFSVSYPACGTEVSAVLAFTPIFPVPVSINLRAQSCHPS